MAISILQLLLWFIFMISKFCHGNPDAKRLYDDLLKKSGYNKLVRPVYNHTDAVQVKFGLSLAQLNDVKWVDVGLKWNREDYGGVEQIYVPSTSIWIPDVVLKNNVDGDYTVTIMTKAMLTYNGEVQWRPPAIFKSHCDIDVSYFPFDSQHCAMVFLPWSHDGYKIDMSHIKRSIYANPRNLSEHPWIEKGIDMDHYVPSQEWDILDVPAQKNIKFYPCCDEPYPDITFNITLRRKTLFYSINIIIPCVGLTMLTLTGFYVPCDCGEKISICITILLSLSMFQLLLFDLLPGTSLTVPLLGKYILFTLFIICGSIGCAVIVLNVKNRPDTAGDVPPLARWLILEMLARLMCMPQPTQEQQDQEVEDQIDWSLAKSDLAGFSNPYRQKFRQRKSVMEETWKSFNSHDGTYVPGMDVSPNFLGVDNLAVSDFCRPCEHERLRKLPPTVVRAAEGIGFVAKRQKESDRTRQTKDDWIYMAMVIDRFLLWIYVSLSFLCTITLLLSAPSLYDNRPGLVPKTPSTPNHNMPPL